MKISKEREKKWTGIRVGRGHAILREKMPSRHNEEGNEGEVVVGGGISRDRSILVKEVCIRKGDRPGTKGEVSERRGTLYRSKRNEAGSALFFAQKKKKIGRAGVT